MAAVVVGSLSGIVGGLVLLYLKTIKQGFDSMSQELKDCKKDIRDCQSSCRQNYVDKVDYIREVTKLEDTLQHVVRKLSEIKGATKALEQMPKVLAEAVRQIVIELNKKEPS